MQSSQEGSLPERDSFKGAKIAIMTSGGDCCGMNSAIKAAVRTANYLGATLYAVNEGYQGLVDGGDYIKEISCSQVSDVNCLGGTVIGTSRPKIFFDRSGRKMACRNLIDLSITKLICIGGNGSLTGANLLRTEWQSFVEELVTEGKISHKQAEENSNLNLVGLVGSIDNDFCGTDMSLGFDSALHRIIEYADNTMPTAKAFQRVFILEVFGGTGGYLPLSAAIAVEADWLFIPEWPAKVGWQVEMCRKLVERRKFGSRLNFIITTDKAIDIEGNRILPEQIAKAISDNLPFDLRINILGHMQLAGIPSPLDRILGFRMGVEAVMTLMQMPNGCDPVLISVRGDKLASVPMVECIKATDKVHQAIKAKDFALAVQLRGAQFHQKLEIYKLQSKL